MFGTVPGMFEADTQALVVNAFDFGFVPTNAAAQNDAAIAAAIAALPSGPAVLLIPASGAGVYSVSQTIIIDRDNVALIGLGNRLGAPTIQVTTDNAYALVVGNTKNANNVLIDGINLQGLASSTSTGGGINFRCVGGKIRQCRVSNFGGTGINVAAFSSTIFEVFLEDLVLIQNGQNTVTPGDNLVIAASVTDFEVIRVISLGNAAKNTTRHCFNIAGGPGKFLACHPYFANQDGLHISGNGNIQVIGGEYETNGAKGINVVSATNILVHAATFFANVGADFASSGTGSVTGCAFQGTNQNVYGTFFTGIIADNYFVGGATPIWLDTSCVDVMIHDNFIQNSDPGIKFTGTGHDVHDNFIAAGGIAELTGANNNLIHDNQIAAGKTITLIGAGTKVRNNVNFNPQGAAAITVTASPFTYTAGNTPEEVYITGGTVNPIVKNGITLFTASPATVHLEPGEAVVVTYTVAPTMNKDRH